jgi:sugar/nucleoside kinase (ribokinase family)
MNECVCMPVRIHAPARPHARIARTVSIPHPRIYRRISACTPARRRPGQVVDTIGAGDSWIGAFLCALHERNALSRAGAAALSDDALRAAMAFASRVAALTCTRKGADPPRRSELA